MTNREFSYEEALEAVDKAIDSALLKSPEPIREYTEYLTSSKGKMMRTRALLACAMNGQDRISEDAVVFATAIEILHLATLVHDDVIDDAGVRRGIPTIQHRFGRRTAVICGDYLLSRAIKQLSGLIRREEYKELEAPDYVERVCMGELRQHLNNGNMDLTAFRYFSIISGKTAALFEASFHAGIATVKRDKGSIAGYRRLGHYLGMIFQLTDDCIDFEEMETTALKPVQSDFEQGVITLPVIAAFARFPELKERAKRCEIRRDELNQAVETSGGLNVARQCARSYYNKAVKLLEEMEMQESKRGILEALFHKAYQGLKK